MLRKHTVQLIVAEPVPQSKGNIKVLTEYLNCYEFSHIINLMI